MPSTTGQASAGAVVGLPYGEQPETCPVRALRAWLAVLPDLRSAVFRRMSRWGTPTRVRLTDQSVALIVKRRVVAIGQDPKLFAGHSLRAGLATSAAAGGAPERDIRQQTRHRSVAMVRRYIREGELFHKRKCGAVHGALREDSPMPPSLTRRKLMAVLQSSCSRCYWCCK